MKKIIVTGSVLAIIIIGAVFLVFKPDRTVEESATVGSPPPAPSIISAYPGVEQITLVWQPVKGATAYNIYWSTQSGVSRSAGNKITPTDTRYIHTGLTGDTSYYYIITAVNAFGESPAGREVSAVAWSRAAPTAEITLPAASENDFEARFMNWLMNMERPGVESPDTGQQEWFPGDEVPPPPEEWPDVGEPTWDPNAEVPPPRSEWPGEGETPQWSPHDEPQRVQTPF